MEATRYALGWGLLAAVPGRWVLFNDPGDARVSDAVWLLVSEGRDDWLTRLDELVEATAALSDAVALDGADGTTTTHGRGRLVTLEGSDQLTLQPKDPRPLVDGLPILAGTVRASAVRLPAERVPASALVPVHASAAGQDSYGFPPMMPMPRSGSRSATVTSSGTDQDEPLLIDGIPEEILAAAAPDGAPAAFMAKFGHLPGIVGHKHQPHRDEPAEANRAEEAEPDAPAGWRPDAAVRAPGGPTQPPVIDEDGLTQDLGRHDLVPTGPRNAAALPVRPGNPTPPRSALPWPPDPSATGGFGATVVRGTGSGPGPASNRPERNAGSDSTPPGVLVLPDGTVVPVISGVVLGRRPAAQIEGSHPHLAQVGPEYGFVSRQHLQIVVDGDQVMAQDLGSRSGTTLTMPGRTPFRLHAGDWYTLEPGSVLDLAGECAVRFEAEG